MTARRALPPRSGTVHPIGDVTEQMCMTIGRERWGAGTMNSFIQSHWRVFFQVFIRTAYEVIRACGDKATLDIEALKAHEDNTILGYRFFLTVCGTEGDTINHCGATVIQDRMLTHKLIADSDKDTKPARDFLKRVDLGRIWAYEVWRLPDERAWEMTVGRCTEHTVRRPLDFTGSIFSPQMAFAMTPDGVCAAQDMDAYDDYYISPPDLLAGRNFAFTAPHYAYSVPRDLVTVNFLYDVQLPDVQIEIALTEFAATRLVPLLLQEDAGPDAIVPDAGPSARKQRRLALLAEAGVNSAFTYPEEADQHLEQHLSAVQGVVDLTTLDGVTPFDEMAKHSAKSTAQIVAHVSNRRPPADAEYAALYKAVPLMTGNARLRPQTAQDEVIAVTACRASRYLQQNMLSLFVPLLRGSPKMSPTGRLIMKYAKANNLTSFADSEAEMFLAPRKGAVSFHTFYVQKLLVNCELIFKVNTLHRLVALAMSFMLDSYRAGLSMHLNLLLLSVMGGTGKSAVFNIMMLLRIPGSIENILYPTAAVFAVDGDANGCRNFSDFCWFFDELPKGLMGDGEEVTDLEARFKAVMTQMYAIYKSMMFTPDGKRESTSTASRWEGTFHGCSNKSLSTGNKGTSASESMTSRWYPYLLSELQSTGRRLEYMMMEEARDQEAIQPLLRSTQRIYQQQQYFHFVVEKMIQAGVIPDVSAHGAVFFLSAFIREAAEDGHVSCQPRTWERVQLHARIKCIQDAWMKLVQDYLYHGKQECDEELTFEKVISISPMLYITAEHMMAAIGDLSDEIYPSLPAAVRLCIRQIYMDQVTEASQLALGADRQKANHRDLFSKEGATDLDRDKRNYSYFSTRSADLIQQILAMIKTFMGDFQPSKNSIEAAVERLGSSTVTSKPYGQTWDHDLHRPTVAPVENTTPKQALVMRKRSEDRSFMDRLEFHVSWIEGAGEKTQQTVKNHANARMGEIITVLMNSEHQLPRSVIFGEVANRPDRAGILVTRTPQSVRSPFSVKNYCQADAENDLLVPEYRAQVNAGLGSDATMTLHCDIDVMALKERALVSSAGAFNVGGSTEELVGSILGAGQQDSGKYFFGMEVPEMGPDKFAAITREQIAAIQATAGKASDTDALFDPSRYMCDNGLGQAKIGHWELVAQNYSPTTFGFSAWEATPKGRQMQYKMNCAWHPLIMIDRYMTPEERLLAKQQRDLLEVPVVPVVPQVPEVPEVPQVPQVPQVPVGVVPRGSDGMQDQDMPDVV
jgi:hypothetical protein